MFSPLRPVIFELALLLSAAVPLLGLSPRAFGQQSATQSAGLAARYPGDNGIEKDPSVIFAEGFEGKDLPTVEYGKAGGFYDLNGYPKLMHLTDKEAAVGKQCLELIHPQNVISPQWFHRSFPGQNALYVRFYRKFERDWVWPVLGQHDTLIFAGKYDSPAATDLSLYLDLFGVQQRWNSRNTVVDRVLNRQPAMVLKSSFQGQGLDFGIGKTIVSHVGWDNYYLLPYNRQPAPELEGGRWYCFEYMGKMNTPGRQDGEVRMWIDGQLVTEMGAFALRKGEWTDVAVKATDLRAGFGWQPAEGLVGSPLNNLKMIFQGTAADRFLLDDFAVIAGTPPKVIYEEKFEAGPGKFSAGEVVAGGFADSQALSFGPKGCWVWDAFTTPADGTATLRFKLKPLGDADKVTLLVWSDKLKNNCLYDVGGLLLRDAAHSGIQWDRWMIGPRYGGKAYKEGPPREQKSWVDGIVVSTRYVGPAQQ